MRKTYCDACGRESDCKWGVSIESVAGKISKPDGERLELKFSVNRAAKTGGVQDVCVWCSVKALVCGLGVTNKELEFENPPKD